MKELEDYRFRLVCSEGYTHGYGDTVEEAKAMEEENREKYSCDLSVILLDSQNREQCQSCGADLTKQRSIKQMTVETSLGNLRGPGERPLLERPSIRKYLVCVECGYEVENP